MRRFWNTWRYVSGERMLSITTISYCNSQRLGGSFWVSSATVAAEVGTALSAPRRNGSGMEHVWRECQPQARSAALFPSEVFEVLPLSARRLAFSPSALSENPEGVIR